MLTSVLSEYEELNLSKANIIVLTSVLSEYGDLNPSQAAVIVLKFD